MTTSSLKQEPWKLLLPAFIEHPYFKRFGRHRPDVVISIKERARMTEDKKALKREMKRRCAGDDVYIVDRADTGLHVLELEGDAEKISGRLTAEGNRP